MRAARLRLLREARSVAALNHPNVCTIHEVGEADGQAYIAMELVEGKPLDLLIPAEGLAGRAGARLRPADRGGGGARARAGDRASRSEARRTRW